MVATLYVSTIDKLYVFYIYMYVHNSVVLTSIQNCSAYEAHADPKQLYIVSYSCRPWE